MLLKHNPELNLTGASNGINSASELSWTENLSTILDQHTKMKQAACSVSLIAKDSNG